MTDTATPPCAMVEAVEPRPLPPHALTIEALYRAAAWLAAARHMLPPDMRIGIDSTGQVHVVIPANAGPIGIRQLTVVTLANRLKLDMPHMGGTPGAPLYEAVGELWHIQTPAGEAT